MKYIIFDMDGTLIDSMPLWQEIGQQFCLSRNIQTEGDMNGLFHQLTIPQVANYFKETFQLAESVEMITDEILKLAYVAYAERIPLKEGVLQALEDFSKAGFKMGVATANEYELTNLVIRRLGLESFISCVKVCSEVGESKKDSPKVFESCLTCLGGDDPREAYVFEDAPHAIKSAKKAGFKTVGIYDLSYAHDNDQLRQASDYYYESARDWSSLLDDQTVMQYE